MSMIGDNRSPSMTEELALKYFGLTHRADELVAGAANVPAEIADDATAGKVADFVKQIMDCGKDAKAGHKTEKEPHLNAGRAVDGFFNAIIGKLDEVKRLIEARETKYRSAKAEKARCEAEKLAKLEREEAERLAAAATTEQDLDTAMAHEAAANEAAAIAAAKPADLSRIRSEHGTVSGLRSNWTFEVKDFAAVPDQFKMLNEPAVRAMIRAGTRDIPGLRVYEEQKIARR